MRWMIVVMLLTGSLAGAAGRIFPRKAVILRSGELSVTLDASDGLPYEYRLGTLRIRGEDAGTPVSAIVCRLKPRAYATVEVRPTSVKQTKSSADFGFEVSFHGQPATSFHLAYRLDGASVVVSMDGVVEREGFNLIEAALPNLATVREEDGPAWLAHGRNGGAVVQLRNATPARLPDDSYFGRIGTVLPLAMIGDGKVACSMEVTAFMDGTEMEITGATGARRAKIGTIQTYRVHGGRSYNMNDSGPRIAGNEKTLNLPVGQMPRTHLDFFGDVDGDGTVDWLDGAKIVRKRMGPIPTRYFDDKLLYMIAGKYKPEPQPRTTFQQSGQLIRDIAMLTDFAPQVAFVSGWVYDGQDTGFPSEDKVNESLGGYEGLMRLMAEGRKYNANVTVNVNYDDAYKSSPEFNEAFIARRPDGEIWRSRDWFGEYSYITGMAKYMERWGLKRIEYAVDRYKLHDAILIDALSWYAIRNDWDREHPASGYKNLVEGRYRVIEEFRKRNVHVVSEQLRYPYVGKLALAVDGVAGGKCPFGGEPVPLLPAIYKRSMIWGGSGPKDDPQRNLFWNARPGPWYENKSDRTEIADFYYLTVLPFAKVHHLEIESYRVNGSRRVIGLEGSSRIDADSTNRSYAVVVGGVEIARDDATFCPIDGQRIAFYSRSARQLKYPLPAGWDASKVTARALSLDGHSEHPVQVASEIMVSVPARRPVIVYRDEQAVMSRGEPSGF